MLYEIIVFAPILGLLAGLLSGLLGIGGGIVIVPTLIYLLPSLLPDVTEQNVALVAIATSLATIIVTAFSSARCHYHNGNVDIKFTTPIVITVAITALIAPYIAAAIGGPLLIIVLALLLMLVALQMLFGKSSEQEQEQQATTSQLLFGGSLTGILAAIAGLGGGAILVPYLTFIKVNIRKAIGAAAASGMVVALFGSIGYLMTGIGFSTSPQFVGYVHWPTAVGIMIFSFLAAPWGAKLGQKLDQKQIKKVFAIFVIVVALKLIIEQF